MIYRQSLTRKQKISYTSVHLQLPTGRHSDPSLDWEGTRQWEGGLTVEVR